MRKGKKIVRGMKNPHMSEQREKDKNTLCIEMHCSGAETEHFYGAPECDWVLRMGSVVARSEFGHPGPRTTRKKG